MKLLRTLDIQVGERYYVIPFPTVPGFIVAVVVLAKALARVAHDREFTVSGVLIAQAIDMKFFFAWVCLGVFIKLAEYSSHTERMLSCLGWDFQNS
jgi:hypothetical protein